MPKTSGGGGKTLTYLLAGVIALATSSAWAASRYWTGEDDTIWDNRANWEDGYIPGNDEVFFQNNKFAQKFTGENGYVITFTNSFSVWRTRLRGAGTEQTPLVFRAADSESGLDFGSNVGIIVADSNGSGHLRIESGTYPISAGIRIGENATYYGQLTVTGGAVLKATNGNMDIQNGKVVLDNGTIEISKTGNSVSLGNKAAGCELHLQNGGLLVTSLIWDGNQGKSSTVLFNGGTLKANGVFSSSWPALIADKPNISVKVGAQGGTVDASGFNIQIAHSIASDGENDGGMTFKGGGSVSLKYANTYTGATKVELGTKVIATTADAKASVLKNLVVTGFAADGDYYVFEYSGLTDADLANVTCPSGAEGTTITRDGNQIKVHYVAPAVDLGWNGGDAAWATANAWTNATGTAKTWTDGNYAVFEDASTITLGANAAAVAATFNADATVAVGGGTLTVPAVTVASGVSATIAAPTAGALVKDGAGTLTLGSSRTDATTLAEGTLVANAPIGTLVFGTDYPVTFDYCGQTLSKIPASAVGGGDVTLKNGTFGSSINVNMNSGSLRVEGDSTVVNCNEFNVGPSDGSTSANYIQIGGNFNAGWHVRDRCGDFIMTNVAITASKNYEVGSSAAATRGRMILSGGSASIAGNLNVFNGELEITNETVEVAGSVNMGSNGNSGLITLMSGGTLATKVIQKYGTPTSATVLFDGGTLRVNAENANGLVRNQEILFIQTSSNGGTIDAAGYAVIVHRTIADKSGETGMMSYKGGGKVTLMAQPTYTGVTTVEVGTTLVIPEAIAGDNLAFVIPEELADGVYTVVSISGDSEFAEGVLSGKEEGFVLSGDRKKICYVKGMDATKPIYIGTDGNLSAPGNWLDNTVPTSGNILLASSTPVTLTAGATFSPDTITIPDGSAVLTLADSLTLATLTNANKLAIASTGSLTVTGDLVVCDGKGTFLHSNEGSVTVGRVVCAKVASVATSKQYDVVTESTKSIRAGGFLYDTSAYWRMESNTAGAGSWIVGENGFKFANLNSAGGNAYRFYAQNSPVILYSSADWTLACTGLPKTDRGDMQVYDSSSLTIDTSDYDTPAIPRTVTLEGRIVAYGPVMIKGCGKVVVDTVDMSDATGVADDLKHTCVTDATTLSVTDTATLQINAGKKITGNGKVSLAAGTKLMLDSGALGAMGDEGFIPCIPGLVLPATGTATIRIDGARLRSDDYAIAAVVSGETGNVDIDLSGTALDGRRATLRVEGGNLILNIEPNGTRIIIR